MFPNHMIALGLVWYDDRFNYKVSLGQSLRLKNNGDGYRYTVCEDQTYFRREGYHIVSW